MASGEQDMTLRWLFIDIGGPILDDGPLFDYLSAALRGILVAQGHPVNGTTYQTAMENGWQEGASSTLDYIIRYFVSTEEEYLRARKAYWEVFDGLSWSEYRRLQPIRAGVPKALSALAGRYRLATLSNNVTRVRDLLAEYGVEHLFSAWGISQEVGRSKPDRELFDYVLDQAGCRPAEAMMVGDRLDNDILPAQKLGLMTALITLKNNFGGPPVHLRGAEADMKASSLVKLAQKLLSGTTAVLSKSATGVDKHPS
jgi:HAD superfamily hydrolase (TIGR01549 family)